MSSYLLLGPVLFQDFELPERISWGGKQRLTVHRLPGGTRVTVAHSLVPDGHTSYRDGGWQHNYFDPMKRYFSE